MTWPRDRHSERDTNLDQWIKAALETELAQMDAAFDFQAGLEDVYTRAGLARPIASESSSDAAVGTGGFLQAVVDHIEMLDSLLRVVTTSDEDTSPQQGVMYLTMARQFLLQLRIGLTARRLTQARATQLVDMIKHNVAEADKILRAQQGLSLQDTVRTRIGELRDLGGDLNHQMQRLRDTVQHLFTDVDELAPHSPVPSN